MDSQKLKIGVIGLGRGFMLSLSTFVGDPRVSLVAACDPRKQALDQFEKDFGGKVYADPEAFFQDPEPDLIYVASPHQFHEQHVLGAIAANKNVLVEKPMALDPEQCRAMIRAAEEAGTHLFVGPSHGFDPPVLLAKKLADSSDYGAVKMITALNFTDFNYRARRPDELDREHGGGVAFSQAAHQIDMVRLLAGANLSSVRAQVGDWDFNRPMDGAYSALLQFDNSVVATMIYSGYAHFNASELCNNINEAGYPVSPEDYGASKKMLSTMTPEDELAWKESRTYGNGVKLAQFSEMPPNNEHFGFFLVSCERADLRTTPVGVDVYADIEREFIPCPEYPASRSSVIDEVCDAVFKGVKPVHDGQWGLDTLEVCHALVRSSDQSEEIYF